MDYWSWADDWSESLPNEAVHSFNGQVFAEFLPVLVIAFEELVGSVCKNIAECDHVAPWYNLWEDKSEAFADFVGVAEISYVGVSEEVNLVFVVIIIGRFLVVHFLCFIGFIVGNYFLCFIGVREARFLIDWSGSVKWGKVSKLWLCLISESLTHHKCEVLKLSRCWIIIHIKSIVSLDLRIEHLPFIGGFSIGLESLDAGVNWGWNVSIKGGFWFLSWHFTGENILRNVHFFVHVVLVHVWGFSRDSWSGARNSKFVLLLALSEHVAETWEVRGVLAMLHTRRVIIHGIEGWIAARSTCDLLTFHRLWIP